VRRQPSNEDIPVEELALAMALQNAGSRGYSAMKGDFFDKYDHCYHGRPVPSKDAIACCFRGALALEDDSWSLDADLWGAAQGNNADDGALPPRGMYVDEVAWRAGAAFEVALRP